MIHNNYKSTVTADADASEVGTVLRVCTLPLWPSLSILLIETSPVLIQCVLCTCIAAFGPTTKQQRCRVNSPVHDCRESHWRPPALSSWLHPQPGSGQEAPLATPQVSTFFCFSPVGGATEHCTPKQPDSRSIPSLQAVTLMNSHRVINSTSLFQTYTVDLIFTVWIQNTQLCVCFCIVDNWCVYLPLWKCWRWYITWLENASGSPQKKPHNVAWERSVCTTLVALVWHYGQKRKEGFTISCMFLPSEMNRFKLKLNLVVLLKQWQHPIWEWHSWLLSLYLSHTRDPGNYPQL